MSSLVDFGKAELEKPVTWSQHQSEVRDDSARGVQFYDDVVKHVQIVSDGGSILIRERDDFERQRIDAVADEKPDTYKLIEGAAPTLANKLSEVASVGMSAGRLQRMLAEMDGDETVNVYLLKMNDFGYAMAFEQLGQVGIVAGKDKLRPCNHLYMRIWEKEEGRSGK